MTDWRHDARCGSLEPSDADRVFFTSDSPERAKRLCAQCPVQQRCLDHATENLIPGGTWGGESAPKRRERLNINVHGHVHGAAREPDFVNVIREHAAAAELAAAAPWSA